MRDPRLPAQRSFAWVAGDGGAGARAVHGSETRRRSGPESSASVTAEPALPRQRPLTREGPATAAGSFEPASVAPSDSLALVSGLILEELRAIRAALAQPKIDADQDPGAPALTVEAAASRLRCSRNQVFELIRRGQLKASKPGKRRMVSLASIDALLAGREEKRRARATRQAKRRASKPRPAAGTPAADEVARSILAIEV
jgi:excisionase family DNA binding protein